MERNSTQDTRVDLRPHRPTFNKGSRSLPGSPNAARKPDPISESKVDNTRASPRWTRKSVQPAQSNYYAFYVLKHNNFTTTECTDGPYDIEIRTSDKPVPRPNDSREVVLERMFATNRSIHMLNLSKFMRWKFRYHQIKDKEVDALIQSNKMTYVDAPLDWIKSIIDVEIDYHFSTHPKCLDKANVKYLKYYVESPWSGYGEEFYSDGPNIKGSRFYTIFSKNL